MSVPSAESAISMPSKMVSAAEVSPFLFKLALILMKPPHLPQATLANWREAPFNRWAFHHVRELIPSADIAHDPARVRPLPPAAEPAGLFEAGFLEDTDTDGIAVMHRGRLIFERYFNGMSAETPHILMSVSKSMLGLLVGA